MAYLPVAGIYEIRNTLDNKVYIGSSINVNKRLAAHRNHLKRGAHGSKHLQASWDKSGAEAFCFKQLIVCAPKDLMFYEQRIMDGYKANQREFGYNKRVVVESCAGTKLSAGHKATRAAGYNSWNDSSRVVTYNSGCLLRHRVRRYVPPEDFGTTLETLYEASDRRIWVNDRAIDTPFFVAAAAFFEGACVAVSVRSQDGVLPSAYPGRPALNAIDVHARVKGEWLKVGSYTVFGETLRVMQNLGPVGPNLIGGQYSSSTEQLFAVFEDPVHFSRDGSKFVTLVTASTYEAQAMGPIEAFASEVSILEGHLTVAEDETISVSFVRHPKTTIDFNPSTGKTYTPYPGSWMSILGGWYLESGEQVFGSNDETASASGVFGVDYGDDGQLLVLTLHHNYTMHATNGGVHNFNTAGTFREAKLVMKCNGVQFSGDLFVGEKSTSSYAETSSSYSIWYPPAGGWPYGNLNNLAYSLSRNGTEETTNTGCCVIYIDARNKCFAAIATETGGKTTWSGSQLTLIDIFTVARTSGAVTSVLTPLRNAIPTFSFGGLAEVKEAAYVYDGDAIEDIVWNNLGVGRTDRIKPIPGRHPLGASLRKKEVVVAVAYPESSIPNYLWVVLDNKLTIAPRDSLKPEHANLAISDVRVFK